MYYTYFVNNDFTTSVIHRAEETYTFRPNSYLKLYKGKCNMFVHVLDIYICVTGTTRKTLPCFHCPVDQLNQSCNSML